MTYGLGNRQVAAATDDSAMGCDDQEKRLAFCLAFLTEKMPDLAAVVKAWPTLPAAIKAGIRAMVEAAASGSE